MAGDAVLRVKRFAALELGIERHDHESLANVVRQALDFGSVELGLPPDHGRAGFAMGDDRDHRLAGQFPCRGEIPGRRIQAVSGAAATIATVTVTDRTVVVIKRIRL